MAIITKPTIDKGQANEIDLSKSDLAAVSKVVNDSYFSDQANWSKVAMEYESDTGEQIEMLIFDASQESPKANFEVSEKAKDNWQVKSVIIMDFDGGFLKINRGDLTVEEFDITLGSVGGETPVGSGFWDSSLAFGNTNYTDNDYTVTATKNYSVNYTQPTVIQAGAKYYWEITPNSVTTSTFYTGLMVFTGAPENSIISSTEKVGFSLIGAGGALTFDYGGPYDTTQVFSGIGNLNGNVLSFAVDIDNNKGYFAIDGVWQNSGDPDLGLNGFDLSDVGSGSYFNTQVGNNLYGWSTLSTGESLSINETPVYAIPSGYTLI